MKAKLKRIKRTQSAPVAPPESASDTRGYGMFKNIIRLPQGWDTKQARRKATKEVITLMGIDK